MYETFFGLQRRPFAATPDPQCWYAGGPYQAAIDELVVCAEQGQGIAMLVAPAGAGKTILCERLVRELSPRFDTVLLRHATFHTRRALLQTLLSEMEQPFDKPTDQELRLILAPVLRRLHQLGRALVLIVDEAHLLPESLLEELRILSDQAQEGKPLVRLILVGQPGLEEKLVYPAMQALNHRIRAQVALSTLTRQETADYLDYRLTWAGGRTEELFTAEAIDLVCQAADGLPRCVNQLCDHALLLAYAAEKQPATATHITTALEDLKHLSLPWNPVAEHHWEPATESETSRVIESEPVMDTDEVRTEPATIEPTAEASSVLPVYRLSDQWDAPEAKTNAVSSFAATTPPAWEITPTPTPPRTETPVMPVDVNAFVEEPVLDRYTALDAGLTPPAMPAAAPVVETVAELPQPLFEERQADAPIPAFQADVALSWNSVLARLTGAHDIDDRLDAVQDVLDAAQADEPAESSPEAFFTSEMSAEDTDLGLSDESTTEDQLASTVHEMLHDTQQELATETSPPESAVFEFGGDDTPVEPSSARTPSPSVEPRRYRHLFTMLRRKQQGRA